jgi:hypothetical protein
MTFDKNQWIFKYIFSLSVECLASSGLNSVINLSPYLRWRALYIWCNVLPLSISYDCKCTKLNLCRALIVMISIPYRSASPRICSSCSVLLIPLVGRLLRSIDLIESDIRSQPNKPSRWSLGEMILFKAKRAISIIPITSYQFDEPNSFLFKPADDLLIEIDQ